MSKLRLEDILVGALGCPLLGTQIQIYSAQCDYKRYRHYEKGIDLESRVITTDLGIQCLLLMAGELFAKLSTTELTTIMLTELFATILAAVLANPSLMMLVNIPVILLYNLAQTSSFLGMTFLAGI